MPSATSTTTTVSYTHLVGYHHNLLGKGLQFVALGTRQFKDVRVLLVRHDAGAGSAIVRQLHKTEVLTGEHTCVKSQFRYGSGHTGKGESNITCLLYTSVQSICGLVVSPYPFLIIEVVYGERIYLASFVY